LIKERLLAYQNLKNDQELMWNFENFFQAHFKLKTVTKTKTAKQEKDLQLCEQIYAINRRIKKFETTPMNKTSLFKVFVE